MNSDGKDKLDKEKLIDLMVERQVRNCFGDTLPFLRPDMTVKSSDKICSDIFEEFFDGIAPEEVSDNEEHFIEIAKKIISNKDWSAIFRQRSKSITFPEKKINCNSLKSGAENLEQVIKDAEYFLKLQKRNKESLIETGYPEFESERAGWLFGSLMRLYYIKIPDTVCRKPNASGESECFFSWLNDACDPFPSSIEESLCPDSAASYPEMVINRGRLQDFYKEEKKRCAITEYLTIANSIKSLKQLYVSQEVKGHQSCIYYEELSSRIKRTIRPAIYELKIDVIEMCLNALKKNKVEDLWSKIEKLIIKHMKNSDILHYCLNLDRSYDSQGLSHPGGFLDLFVSVLQYERVLKGDLVHNYFGEFNETIREFPLYGDSEIAEIWNKRRKRLFSELKTKGTFPLIKGKHREQLKEIGEKAAVVMNDFDFVPEFKNVICKQQEIGFITYPTPEGAKWSDLSINFVARDAVDIQFIGGKRDNKNFAEMGFKHGSSNNQPNRLWFLLMAFGLFNGNINPYDNSSIGKQNFIKLKEDVSDLRTALKQYFIINEYKPIADYANDKSNKFKYGKRLDGFTAMFNVSASNPYGLEDYCEYKLYKIGYLSPPSV
ncbi:MAG: hypothetical protein P9M03_03570 [Candidatus Theseobacter exili]|nr:hypothetical protein [Candidatus Theseobacter exili]